MTIPIHPVVVQHEGLGETAQKAFQPLVQALALNRQFKQQKEEFQLKMQEFQLEQFRTQKQGEKTDQEIAESRAREAELKQQMESEQRKIVGQEAGNKALSLAAMRAQAENIAFGSPEWGPLMRDTRASLHDLDAKTADIGAAHGVLDAYEEQLRESAKATADIERDAAAIELDRQRLVNERQDAALARQRADTDLRKEVLNQMRLLPGVQAGPIADQLNAPLDIDPNAAISPEQAGGSGGEAARKASQLGRMMQLSNSLIESVEDKTGGITIRASLLRSTKSNALDIVLNSVISPEQRQLVFGYRAFGDAFRFSLSGQQSSDREALRMLNTVAAQASDDRETRRAKRLLRNVMTQATLDAAAGMITPTAGMDNIIEQATMLNFPEWKMEIFRQQREEAAAYERRLAAGQGPLMGISEQPTTTDGLADSTEKVNDLLDRMFRVVQ